MLIFGRQSRSPVDDRAILDNDSDKSEALVTKNSDEFLLDLTLTPILSAGIGYDIKYLFMQFFDVALT